MKAHEILLNRLGACSDASEFASTYPNLKKAWENCPRPDWMIWLLTHTGYDNPKLFRLYACWCVRNTPIGDGRVIWGLLTDERSKNAVIIAERYANGEATESELAAAWAAARDAAGAGAGDAAWAAVWAAAGDAWAAARDAAGDAAWAAAGDAQANHLRELITYSDVSKLVKSYKTQNKIK